MRVGLVSRSVAIVRGLAFLVRTAQLVSRLFLSLSLRIFQPVRVCLMLGSVFELLRAMKAGALVDTVAAAPAAVSEGLGKAQAAAKSAGELLESIPRTAQEIPREVCSTPDTIEIAYLQSMDFQREPQSKHYL